MSAYTRHNTPLLVGVIHGFHPVQELMNAHCKATWREQIVPLIDDDSLIILEDGYRKKIMTRRDMMYYFAHERAKVVLDALPKKPAIAWRDVRDRLWPLSELDGRYAICALVEFEHLIIADDGIRSVDELVRAITERRLVRAYTREINDNDREIAQKVKGEFDRFDRCVLDTINEWGGIGRVFIVTGLLHSISLHLKTGWPIRNLCDQESMSSIAQQAAITIAFPSLVCEQLSNEHAP